MARGATPHPAFGHPLPARIAGRGATTLGLVERAAARGNRILQTRVPPRSSSGTLQAHAVLPFSPALFAGEKAVTYPPMCDISILRIDGVEAERISE
jgi:hypothetical protein